MSVDATETQASYKRKLRMAHRTNFVRTEPQALDHTVPSSTHEKPELRQRGLHRPYQSKTSLLAISELGTSVSKMINLAHFELRACTISVNAIPESQTNQLPSINTV
jgi:hypothetical protein